MTTVEPRILIAIVQKYAATLRTVSFHKISLRGNAGLESIYRVNLWADLFGQLGRLDLVLSALNLSYLSQEQPGQQHVRGVVFMDTRDDRVRNWAGPDVQSGLRDFITHSEVIGVDFNTDDDEYSSDGEYQSRFYFSNHILLLVLLLFFSDSDV